MAPAAGDARAQAEEEDDSADSEQVSVRREATRKAQVAEKKKPVEAESRSGKAKARQADAKKKKAKKAEGEEAAAGKEESKRDASSAWRPRFAELRQAKRWAALYGETSALLARDAEFAHDPDFALYRAEAALETRRYSEALRRARAWLGHGRYGSRAQSLVDEAQKRAAAENSDRE